MDIQLVALYTCPNYRHHRLTLWLVSDQKSPQNRRRWSKLKKLPKPSVMAPNAYLNRQFKVVIPIMLALAVLIDFTLGAGIAVTFIMGAVFSAIIGYFGMWIAVRANVRTANAAQKGLNPALKVAFGAGTVNGMLVVGLGLLGVSLIYMWAYFTYNRSGSGNGHSQCHPSFSRLWFWRRFACSLYAGRWRYFYQSR